MCLLPGGARLNRYSRPWHTAPTMRAGLKTLFVDGTGHTPPVVLDFMCFSSEKHVACSFAPRGRVGLVSGTPSPLSQTASVLIIYFLGTRTSAESELNLSFWGTGSSTQSVLGAKGAGSCLGYLDTSLPVRASFPAGGTHRAPLGGGSQPGVL